MTNCSILVADDHPIFRKGLVDLLKEIKEIDIDIVAEVGDGVEAYQKIIALRPTIAILDYEMPQLKGLDVLQKLRSGKCDSKFIMLTMHRDKEYYNEAMKLGVSGYLLKENAESELKNCVLKVFMGEAFAPQNLDLVLEENLQIKLLPAEVSDLTPTEKVILKLISENKTSQHIADLLFISPNTVDNHRGKMVKKLNIEGKNALLKFAMEYKDIL